MPLPLLLIGLAIGSGLIGAKKGANAVTMNSQAKDIQEEAQNALEKAEKSLSRARKKTTKCLEELGKEKLLVWNKQIGSFVRTFEQIRNVEIEGQPITGELNGQAFDKSELAQMKDISVKAHEIVVGGFSAVGTGALVGVASYGGAMMFATASTGTAISTLAGAAATNATLAWFGGGALATGGLGIAGGTAVLGGLVAGPALAVGGAVLEAKARENLAKARSNMSEAKKAATQMKNATKVLKAISTVAEEYHSVVQRLAVKMDDALDSLGKVIDLQGTDYRRYGELDRRKVHLAVNFAQVMKLILEAPILTEDGALSPSHREALDQGKAILTDEA
jgi:hypothetical protein